MSDTGRSLIIDEQQLGERLGWDAEFAEELLKSAVAQYEPEYTRLLVVLAEGNLKAVRPMAHRMRGGLLSLGAVRAGDLLLQVEKLNESVSIPQAVALGQEAREAFFEAAEELGVLVVRWKKRSQT